MLTPFSSGVTPTASMKTNSSDQRMSPAFAGAQPLAESQTAATTLQPAIGLEPEALLANVKTETATALNQTVLQTLAAAVAARMGVERLPDELLEAFFIRLAAAIERKPLIEQGKIEGRAGLKALQIPLRDLAPALRDPSGSVAARLTAKAEAPMAAPQKTAAAEITGSYLEAGSTPARSAETVAMGERNKLSSSNGNLLFQNVTPRTAETEADNASQTQFRTLFAPDSLGFESEKPETAAYGKDNTQDDMVARRGAGPAASGKEGLPAASPDLHGEAGAHEADSPATSSSGNAAKTAGREQSLSEPHSGAGGKLPATAAGPQWSSMAAQDIASPATRRDSSETPLPSGAARQQPDAVQAGARSFLRDVPPLSPTADFIDTAADLDLQRRLFTLLTTTDPVDQDGSETMPGSTDSQTAKIPAATRDAAEMAARRHVAEPAAERAPQSRDPVGAPSPPSSSAIPAQFEVAQRGSSTAHLGIPFGYVTTPPAAEPFEAEKDEDGERRGGGDDSADDEAAQDGETPEQRRERLARDAVERLLRAEPEQAPEVAINRESSEADRAFAYYQRLAGF